MRLIKGVVILAVSVLMLGACSQRSAESYASIDELAQALVSEDVGCEQLETENSDAELVKEQGRCEIDGETLEIFLFDSEKQRDGWLEFGGRLRPATATGPNWAIIGDKAPVTEAAEALGSELRVP